MTPIAHEHPSSSAPASPHLAATFIKAALAFSAAGLTAYLKIYTDVSMFWMVSAGLLTMVCGRSLMADINGRWTRFSSASSQQARLLFILVFFAVVGGICAYLMIDGGAL